MAVDENRSPRFQVPDDVRVVDDLSSYVDGRSVHLERPLHRLHRPRHAGAVASV